MDISKINIARACNDGVDIEILNPVNNEPMGLKIRAVGAMSNNYRDDMALLIADIEDFKEQNKVDEKSSKRKIAEFNLKVEKYENEITSEFLAKYTIGWSGMTENGKEIAFSKGEAKRIYLEYSLITSQVQKGMMDIANFIKA